MAQSSASNTSSPFTGKTIVLELGHEIGFKNKQAVINYLREQHAHITYTLTASVCSLFNFDFMVKINIFLD